MIRAHISFRTKLTVLYSSQGYNLKACLAFFSILRLFEMNATVPIVKDLKITVMDYDIIGRDDVIGETTIDLEQRILSRYRATCGCSQSYCK